MLNRLIRRTIAWATFYSVFAAVIVISDHLVPNVLYLNL